MCTVSMQRPDTMMMRLQGGGAFDVSGSSVVELQHCTITESRSCDKVRRPCWKFDANKKDVMLAGMS